MCVCAVEPPNIDPKHVPRWCGSGQDTPRETCHISLEEREAGSQFLIPCTNQRPENDEQSSRRRRYTFGGDFMSVDVSASPLYHTRTSNVLFGDGLGLAGDHRVIIASSSAKLTLLCFVFIVPRMSRNGSVSWHRVICYSQCHH